MTIADSINNRRIQDTDDINTVISRWVKYNAPKDASAIYNHLKPTIDSAVTSYAGGNRSMRVPAYRIAFDAVKTFDPSKGVDVRTHVYNNLKRLNRINADRSNIVHIPEGVSRDRQLIAKTISDFTDEYNREPNDDELSDITKLSKKRIDHIMSHSSAISSSESVTAEGADRVSSKGISDDTYIDYLYSSSDNIDKKIIEMTSGVRGSKIYKSTEVARRLNMTPAAVSLRMNNLRKRMADIRSLV